MIGEHTVSLIPDPDVLAWGPLLNSNPYLTTDLAGWINYPFTDPWVWGVGGYAVGPTGGSVGGWFVRSDTAPIPRDASTIYRVRIRFSVAAPGSVTGGLFYGDTATAAMNGPFWAGATHCVGAETTLNIPTAGSYVLEIAHNTAGVPPQFAFLAPEIHFAKDQRPVIDSIELNGQGADVVDLSCLVDSVTIRHGREDSDSQPDAATATLELSVNTAEETFAESLEIGGILRVSTALISAYSTRFVGRITDISTSWDDAGEDTPNRLRATVIAAAILSDLGRRIVGDAPFPQELDGARVARVLSLADVTLDPTYSDPGTVQILARDIDSRAALEIAQGTATSASGIVWHTRGGEVRYADADHRRGATTALDLDACDVLVTPQWRRSTEALLNRVSIGYGVAPEGSEQSRYVADKIESVDAYGRYELSAETELVALADAEKMGQLLLTRNSAPVWLMSELPVDVKNLDADRTTALLALDMHSLIQLSGLPAAGSAPTSAALWVEGWTERLAWGEHELTLTVSGYCRTAPAPRWDDLDPEETWDSFDTVDQWDETTCLGPIQHTGRWADVPSSVRWNGAGLGTWDQWH